MNRLLFHSVASILAATYFAFQIECFDEEYEANHRPVSNTSAIGSPTTTWETFDKSNAPKAFVFDARTTFQIRRLAVNLNIPRLTYTIDDAIVRDKSPPCAGVQDK
jgi:hypothetical protein